MMLISVTSAAWLPGESWNSCLKFTVNLWISEDGWRSSRDQAALRHRDRYKRRLENWRGKHWNILEPHVSHLTLGSIKQPQSESPVPFPTDGEVEAAHNLELQSYSTMDRYLNQSKFILHSLILVFITSKSASRALCGKARCGGPRKPVRKRPVAVHSFKPWPK